MGREVRRVPKDWSHPKDNNNRYIPLYEGIKNLDLKIEQWHAKNDLWNDGKHPDQKEFPEYKPYGHRFCSYTEWFGGPPNPENYMPYWSEEERTHYQMYEVVTEGTPMSPICETPEELAQWLADNKASAFGRQTATYAEWLKMINKGFAISAVLSEGSLIPGVRDC